MLIMVGFGGGAAAQEAWAESAATLAASPPASASTGQDCPSPENSGGNTIVIAEIDGWRTLVGSGGERITPAAIADFGSIAPHSTDVLQAADDALTKAMARFAGQPLSVRYLGERADRRGRRPALLYAGSRLIQAERVRAGVAIAFPLGETLPCAAELVGAENQARAARRGFWKRDTDWIAGGRPERFRGRLNRFVIMQARVVSVGTRDRRSYLNFGGLWANDVTVEVPAPNREAFGGAAALEALAGQWVRIRGFAVEKSGPMIEIRQPWQIEMLTKYRK